jgi:LPS-assembly lipoprotein
MSLFERRKLLLGLAVLPLAGCGFQPVYQQGGAAAGLRGALVFNLIETPEGFLLLQSLEQRFGSGGAGVQYDVNLDLNITEDTLVLTATTGLSRVTVNGTVYLSVRARGAEEVLFSDRLRSTTSYTSSAETLVTKSARRDARARLVDALAELIVLRLSSTADSWATV